jgi:hypothetical protein
MSDSIIRVYSVGFAMQTVEKLKERGRLGDLGIDGKIT